MCNKGRRRPPVPGCVVWWCFCCLLVSASGSVCASFSCIVAVSSGKLRAAASAWAMVASCGSGSVRWSVPYPVPFDFCKMSVYGINQTCGGAADCFKRASVLQVLFRCSTRRYTHKNIRRIKPVMLANCIGDASPVLAGAAVLGAFWYGARAVSCSVAGDFMDCGLDILQFVHTLVDRDTLFPHNCSVLFTPPLSASNHSKVWGKFLSWAAKILGIVSTLLRQFIGGKGRKPFPSVCEYQR